MPCALPGYRKRFVLVKLWGLDKPILQICPDSSTLTIDLKISFYFNPFLCHHFCPYNGGSKISHFSPSFLSVKV